MKKYKVEIVRSETYVIDVLAKNKQEAFEKAEFKFEGLSDAEMEHYFSQDGGSVEIGNIYDVTNTDDPFNP